MIWRRSLWWQLLLLAGSCLLLVGIFQVWFSNDQTPVASRYRKSPAVPKVTPLRDQQSLSAFAVVASQDLFSESRQGVPTKAAKPQASLEGHTLLGTIIIGHERAALISTKKARGRGLPEVEVIRLGEEWEGFKIVEISNESVVFQGKNGKKRLNFPE